MPDPCTPFSLSLLVANRGNDQQINFGLTKGCTDRDAAFWIITFVLKQKDADGNFFDRVSFHLNVNQEAPGKVDKASNLQNGLTVNQQNFVQGPIAEAALRESQPADVPAAAFAADAVNQLSAHVRGERKSAPAPFAKALAATRPAQPTLKELTIVLLDIQ